MDVCCNDHFFFIDKLQYIYIHIYGLDVAELVEHQTGTLLTQVCFPRCGKRFFSQSTFSADSLTVSVTFLCAIHVKDPIVHVRSVDYGNTKMPKLHRRLGSTLLYPGKSNSNFPWGTIQLCVFSPLCRGCQKGC